MPLMTIEDRITVITSHMASIQRGLKHGNIEGLATFFDHIAEVAKEAADYYRAKEQGGDNVSPPAP